MPVASDEARAHERLEPGVCGLVDVVWSMLVTRLLPGAFGSSNERVSLLIRASYPAMSHVHRVPCDGLGFERQPISATVPVMGSSVSVDEQPGDGHRDDQTSDLRHECRPA